MHWLGILKWSFLFTSIFIRFINGEHYGSSLDPVVANRHTCAARTEYYDCVFKNVFINESYHTIPFGSSIAEWNNETSLDFVNSAIRSLPRTLVDTFRNVEVLNLEHLGIETIERNALANGRNIKKLHLSYNNIASLDLGVFDNLVSLDCLEMDRNNLNNIPNGLFYNKPNLLVVSLANNNLQLIKDNTFVDNTKLESVNVASNKLVHFDLSYIPSLYEVNVNYNMLQVLSIPEDIYYLLASHNQIRYVFGEGQNVLDRLDLSYNKLSTIRWLKDFKQINMLDLSFNEIEDLSAREFEQLEKLTILKLNNNRLLTFDVPSDAPPAVLRSLDLSHNRLVRLSYNQQQFEQLEDLYLDHNSLISVTLGVTRKFKNLKLAHNDWDCATLMKLFKNIRFGTVVDYNSEMVCPNEHERGICCKESDIPYLDRLLQFTAVVISHDKKILANSQCNPSSLPVIYPGALSTAELEKEIQIFKKELQSLEVNIEEKESQVTQNVHKIDELIRMYRVATGDNAEPSYNLEQVLEHLKRREQFTVNETIARYDQAKAKENELGPITYETNHLDATLNAKRSARMTMYMETAQLFKLVQKLQKEVNRIATNNMRMIT